VRILYSKLHPVWRLSTPFQCLANPAHSIPIDSGAFQPPCQRTLRMLQLPVILAPLNPLWCLADPAPGPALGAGRKGRGGPRGKAEARLPAHQRPPAAPRGSWEDPLVWPPLHKDGISLLPAAKSRAVRQSGCPQPWIPDLPHSSTAGTVLLSLYALWYATMYVTG